MEPSRGIKRGVFEGIVKIAEAMVGAIRRGQLAWVIVGAVVGAGLGSLLGLIDFWWLIPGLALGTLVGAAVFAALFPAPVPTAAPLAADNQPFSPGAILATWTTQHNDLPRIVVLMNRAVYVAWDKSAPWQHVADRLNAGLDPQLPAGELIPLHSVTHLGIPDGLPDPMCGIFYSRGEKTLYFEAIFSSHPEREQFLATLSNQMGGSLSQTQVPDGFFTSTWAPLSLLVVLGLLTIGAVILSNYWIANPPPPPAGKTERDPLAASLMSLGPLGTLGVAAVPIALVGAWFVFRTVRRTTTTFFKPMKQSTPPST